MKAIKYCDYQRCKNYKQRDRNLCYVHEKTLKSSSKSLPILLTVFTLMTVMLSTYMYMYVEDVYVNATVKLIESCGYEKYEEYAYDMFSGFVTNVTEKCVELYNVIDGVINNVQ